MRDLYQLVCYVIAGLCFGAALFDQFSNGATVMGGFVLILGFQVLHSASLDKIEKKLEDK